MQTYWNRTPIVQTIGRAYRSVQHKKTLLSIFNDELSLHKTPIIQITSRVYRSIQHKETLLSILKDEPLCHIIVDILIEKEYNVFKFNDRFLSIYLSKVGTNNILSFPACPIIDVVGEYLRKWIKRTSSRLIQNTSFFMWAIGDTEYGNQFCLYPRINMQQIPGRISIDMYADIHRTVSSKIVCGYCYGKR